MKWTHYRRGSVPLFRLFMPLEGIKILKGDDMVDNLYSNKKEELIWYWGKKDLERIEKAMIKELKTKDKTRLKKLFFGMEKSLKVYEELNNLDLKKMSADEIIKTYKNYNQKVAYDYAVANTQIDAFDASPNEYFKKLIRSFFPKNMGGEEFNKVFSVLTYSESLSFIKEEEIDILRIIQKIKEDNLVIKDVKEDIELLEKKYFWTLIGWENIKLKGYDDFKKEIQGKLKEVSDINSQIKKELSTIENIKKRKKEIIDKYNVDKEIYEYIDILDGFIKSHDFRKKLQMKALYAHYLLLWETCNRTGAREEDLEHLTLNEVYEVLKGKKVDEELVKKRKFSATVTIINGQLRIYEGEDSEKIREKELEEDFEKTDILKGMSASPGKVIGTAKICNGVIDAKEKIRKGDILITNMTLPDYVVYMRIAAAIVTNEGGLTSHAAIVARELKKPCVTGTKFATKVFKDGDMIEVDANKGVVKKIK